jgi:hypothetical protein
MAEQERWPILAMIVEPIVTLVIFPSPVTEYEGSKEKEVFQSPFDCFTAGISTKLLPTVNRIYIGSEKSELGFEETKRFPPKTTEFVI